MPLRRGRHRQRFIPASIFKIANSPIALETAVVADENEVVPYGGKPQPRDAWAQDLPTREAIVVSSLPVYRELARYHSWLERLDYGNRTPDTGWWVGWVEREGAIFAFALNIDILSNEDAAKRKTLDLTVLGRLGLAP